MDIEEEIRPKIEQLLSSRSPHMGSALGIEFQIISRKKMKAVMPVNQNTVQPFGILHGGASVALAETLASIGAWLNLKDDTQKAVGLEINANHIRPVPEGNKVTGTATPLHKGASTQIWEIRIENEAGKLVCISRCTLAIIKGR